MTAWISVKEKLPEFGATVLVRYPSGSDLSNVYAWGGRIEAEGEDGAGWCWGIHLAYGGIRPDKDADWNDIDCEDDYPVTHWMPLPTPPETAL